MSNPLRSIRTTPSFTGLKAKSVKTSKAAQGSSAKTNTQCEMLLRRELWLMGLRYRLHVPGLPGRPDIVFPRQRVVIFCDGDFWHGRDFEKLLAKLAQGHNAPYWTAKIRRNVERDQQQTEALISLGWVVLRIWESDILRDVRRQATVVMEMLAQRGETLGK
jgi:DNA mismatch endonuclease (patch repair protein)